MEQIILILNVDFAVHLHYGFASKKHILNISGTTHYCDPCHRNIRPKMEKPCLGGDKCPLGMPHKPNG